MCNFSRALRRWTLLLGLLSAWGLAQGFGFEDLAERARLQALAPYRDDSPPLRAELAALGYDQLRDIRYKPARSIWRKERLPFELSFFHRGGLQSQQVRVNEIAPDGRVRPIEQGAGDFDYGRTGLAGGDAPGFAGLRVHHRLNSPTRMDELLVFQGASYFRALGAGQRYGLSARGLAIDTVGGGAEEFPRFTEFWLERPATDARQLTIHALLDSPRASGAYRFLVRPGDSTVIEVRARLFLRAGVTTLGLAPLTSMFLHGENQPQPRDFRPEVHDSDGLMLASADGQWLWRPLQNPAGTTVSSFPLPAGPRGFGLMQRDRRYASYEDSEARYELRPSAWVEPIGDWGAGRVELVQLHAPDEAHDNIVAYWVPARPPAPGEAFDFAYRLHLQGGAQQRPPRAWVAQTRVGQGHEKLAAGERQLIVDFDGPALQRLADDSPVRAVLGSAGGARIVDHNVYRNPATGGWRLSLRVQPPAAGQAGELRGHLQYRNEAVSETWTTLITAP
ncbi:glucan biosynthesis protein G [Roseateles violae]|uniref:Glucans biosynthesis protein G n=1 Tax=Roseateles violae TaxID=3058042 RepID=A0ABT8DJP3_9BURK|nr:glucan biosynthesis protein G [Pelomonas sp. PFR6]MDN3918656.1 glucan biosynthesis protein G [Pelomonas sp. PFR6]